MNAAQLLGSVRRYLAPIVQNVSSFLRSLLSSAASPPLSSAGATLPGAVQPTAGLSVTLHGLSADSLNGRSGKLVSSTANANGRWETEVQMADGETKQIAVKLSNMVWQGRQVQVQKAPEEDWKNVMGLVAGDAPGDNGLWDIDVRKVMNVKPANLTISGDAAGSASHGAAVTIQGLQAAKAYNGLKGTVTSQQANEQGRWEVEVSKVLTVALADLSFELPWAAALFGERLLTKSGLQNTSDLLSGKKAVLVYFSAHWCPPCKGFTPVLAEAYKRSGNKEVEVVFASSDRDAGSFASYYAEMPWIALPFEDSSRKAALSSKFGVQGIPMLVVLRGSDGSVANSNGRGAVQACGGDLSKCLAQWGCA
eukprot:TRINITY_DN111687_c0_g1_i1.p1 TRINITY_DN111687_c0_g1~~TRINITY_DN111687_c0_g1_i1.p1  ORF type:complete len:366 (-),score=86.20 TRINITY_DN111687_c0_g1_i1:368-1465(-)